MNRCISRVLTILFWVEILASFAAIFYVSIADIEPVLQNVTSNPAFGSDASLGSVILFSAFLTMFFELLIFLFFSTANKIVYEHALFLNLTSFVILASIWLFMDSHIAYVLFKCHISFSLVSFFTFSLMFIPLLFFVRDTCTYGKNSINFLVSVFIFNFAANFIFMLLSNFVFPQPLIFVHILILISAAVFVFISCLGIFYYKYMEAPELPLCVIMLCMSGIFLLNANKSIEYISLFNICLFSVMMILTLGAIGRTFSTISKNKSFKTISDSIPSGIFMAKNDEHLTITYANEAFYRMYGYTSALDAKNHGFLYADFTFSDVHKNDLSAALKHHIANDIYQFELETHEHDINGNDICLLTCIDYQPKTNDIFASAIDITQRKAMEEQLRIREEEYRIAVSQSDKYIFVYDIKTKTIYQQASSAKLFNIAERIENAPESVLDMDIIAPESEKSYCDFYEAMQHGEKRGSTSVRIRNAVIEDYAWYRIDFTTIFDSNGEPERGIISLYDITDSREKELAYERTRQEFLNISPEQISSFECNLTQDKIEKTDGKLLPENNCHFTFHEYVEYSLKCIHQYYKIPFAALMNRERLLENFEKGIYKQNLDYKRTIGNSDYKWIHTTIQLVRYPDSREIKAFIVVKDIDTEKRMELAKIKQAQCDPLTGALNRAVFSSMTEALINSEPTEQHAFVMIDIDNFKQINDNFGHIEGDYVLKEIVVSLKSILREGDMIGRLGGDEFMLFLKNIPFDDAIDKYAQLVCQLISSITNLCTRISGSIGVAMSPRDGQTFSQLYKKADCAMYKAKQSGRNCYVIYKPDMDSFNQEPIETPIDHPCLSTDDSTQSVDTPMQNNALQNVLDNAERNRLIVDSIGLIVMEWNVEADTYYMDQRLKRYILGHQAPAEIFSNRGDPDSVHPDDMPLLISNFFLPLKLGEDIADVDLRLKRIDNEYDLCNLRALLFRDKSGQLLRVIGTVCVIQHR